jgi:hypothetical protein
MIKSPPASMSMASVGGMIDFIKHVSAPRSVQSDRWEYQICILIHLAKKFINNIFSYIYKKIWLTTHFTEFSESIFALAQKNKQYVFLIQTQEVNGGQVTLWNVFSIAKRVNILMLMNLHCNSSC